MSIKQINTKSLIDSVVELRPCINREDVSIGKFVAETIKETLLPLRSVLVYPHFAGAPNMDGEIFNVAHELANEIASEIQKTERPAKRFSINKWIEGGVLGNTLAYAEDGNGCTVVQLEPLPDFRNDTVRVVTMKSWIGPVFNAEGAFACVLIPASQYYLDEHKPPRKLDVLLGDLQSAISPPKRFKVEMQAFEAEDEKFGIWIFAHARWDEATDVEVKARRINRERNSSKNSS